MALLQKILRTLKNYIDKKKKYTYIYIERERESTETKTSIQFASQHFRVHMHGFASTEIDFSRREDRIMRVII